MDYKNLANDIIKEIGGAENVSNVTHCATRLRFNLKDYQAPNADKLRILKGVTGVVNSNNQYQVIIGPEVASVYRELPLESLGKASTAEAKSDASLVSRLLDFIAGSFTPMIAVVAAGGMLQVVLSLLQLTGVLAETDSTYLVINEISQACFFFIPIFLGFSVATRLRIDGYLGALVGGILVMPSLSALIMQEGGISFLGVQVPQVSYGSSVLPVLISVWLLSYVYRFVDKWLPNAVKFILRPLISIMIIAPIALLVVGPIGVYAGNYVAMFLNFLLENFGAFAVMFMGAFAQLLVMTGMHTTLTPILLTSLAANGYDSLIVPGMLIGLASQVGITLAAGIRTKNPEFKQLSFSSAITALMGVSEPALYGVTVKLKKPIIGMIISGAVGGLYLGIMNINTPVIIASFLAIPSYSNVLHTIIGVGLAMAIAFAYTWVFVKDEDYPGGDEHSEPENRADFESGQGTEVAAPVVGRVVPLSDVPDKAFASLALGKGVAIAPTEEDVYAPFNGTVTAVFPGNHAIGLTSDDGVELLIHVGIDTVTLNGEGFNRFVEQGDRVELGQHLLSFDLNTIKAHHLSSLAMVVVTNTNEYADVFTTEVDFVNQSDLLLNIIK